MGIQLPALFDPNAPWHVSAAAARGMADTLQPVTPTNLPERLGARYALVQAQQRFEDYVHENLTRKQRKFLDEYLANNFDAGKAALVAGFTVEEAGHVGRKMLRKDVVQAAIELAMAYYAERDTTKISDIEDELRILAMSNIADFVDEDGTLNEALDWKSPKIRAIKKITREPTRYGTKITTELHDKLGALGKLLALKQAQAGISDETARQGGDTIVNVQSINIIPVPQGQFLPAPPETQKIQPMVSGRGSMIDITPNQPVSLPSSPKVQPEAVEPA